MNSLLHHLVEALRTELQQYGEMLAVLDARQVCFVRGTHSPERPADFGIPAQHAAIAAARDARFRWQRQVASRLGRAGDLPLITLSHLLPVPYRGLITALAQENLELAQRVRVRAETDVQSFTSAATPTPIPAPLNSQPITPPAASTQSPVDSAGGFLFSTV